MHKKNKEQSKPDGAASGGGCEPDGGTTHLNSLKLANTQDKEAHITSYTLATTNLKGYQNVT